MPLGMPIRGPCRAALAALLAVAAILAGAGGRAWAESPPALDEGLEGPGPHAVIVRFADQLFLEAGDYEAWARRHSAAKRSTLRRDTVALLRAKSDTTWKRVEARIAALEKSGAVQAVQRYWIVNGFACLASAEACAEIAALPEVDFVCRMPRGLPRQHAVEPPAVPAAEREAARAALAEGLKAWRDDAADPFDPEAVEIPWNLRRIGADKAWREEQATGRGVVVAVSDTGLAPLPPLLAALWRNPAARDDGTETAPGYRGDFFGWNFDLDDNLALGDGPGVPHGSICAGIIAGRPADGQKFVTGVAPRARLMILRGRATLRSYEYAVLNGADILSMSYMFPGMDLGQARGIFRLAFEHLSACGVLPVGGAGNFSRRFPAGEQIALPKDVPCVIAVAGIVEDGGKGTASSEGPCFWEDQRHYSDHPRDRPLRKPDLTACFGGYPVWLPAAVEKQVPQRFAARGDAPAWTWTWQDERRQYGLAVGPQGNSFSGPHVAGVAALMLSVNADLHPWEVKALLEQTARDLGRPGWDEQFGHGLVQAAEAVKAAKAVRK